MHIRSTDTSIEVQAPAKINLSLEVLRKRTDGYHEIETIIVAVNVYDRLIVTSRSDDEIRLTCRWDCGTAARDMTAAASSIPTGRDNLIWKAANLLREQAGVIKGADIQLIKRIPAAAGLGGASSDAAAALVAANAAWGLEWPRERLAEVGARLGSDVPFFLTGSAAICRGRGEQIESIVAVRLHVVIVRPPVGLSTPEVYAACQPAASRGTAERLAAVMRKGNAAQVGGQLTNGLESAASSRTPWINRLKSEFERQGLVGQQMSGSGSSYFGIAHSWRQARRTAARLRSRAIGTVFAARIDNGESATAM